MNKHADALVVLEEVAISLKESAEQIEQGDQFEEGRLLGYYEALSTLLSQCKVAGIDPGEIGLTGFIPEDLLKKHKQAA